jgi:hypothetical protein
LAYLRDADGQQVIVILARDPGGRPGDALPVAHGAIADGTEFEELLSGARATVAGGHLPVGALSSGVAVWTSVGDPGSGER